MLFSGLMFITLVGGSYCLSSECLQQMETVCSYNLRARHFPTSAEELEEFCQYITDSGKCALRIYEECERSRRFGLSKDFWDFQKRINFFTESCKNSSHLYKAMSSNIECVATTIKNLRGACYFSYVKEKYQKRIFKMNRWIPRSCLRDIWTDYCFNAKFFLECGEETRNAVSEIAPYAVYFSDIGECDMYKSSLEAIQLEEIFKSVFVQGKNVNQGLSDMFTMAKIVPKCLTWDTPSKMYSYKVFE